MIWFGLAVVAVVLFAIHYYRAGDPLAVGEVCMALVIGLVFALFVNVVGLIFPSGESVQSYPLVSLSDNTGIRGSFFLGSGYVDSTPYYSYYVETPKGIQLVNDPTYNAYIKFDTGAPHVKVYSTVYGRSWFSIFSGTTEDSREFHIPAGSITNKFVLDAK